MPECYTISDSLCIQNWSLHLRSVGLEDGGLYLCQVLDISTPYLDSIHAHIIYTLSTQYLHIIYTASLPDCPAPAPECHRQPRRHRGLGRHRGQQGEGGPGHNTRPCRQYRPLRRCSGRGQACSWCASSGTSPSPQPSSSGQYNTVQCSTVQYRNLPPAFIFWSVQYSSVQYPSSGQWSHHNSLSINPSA